MPSKSAAQHRLAQMACAGKSDQMPKDVGCEYLAADKAQHKFQGKRKRKARHKRKHD